MKKRNLLLTVLIAILLVAMTACGGGESQGETQPEAQKEDKPETQPEVQTEKTDYSSMQQDNEPLEIYEGTPIDTPAIASVEPTKEMLQEVVDKFDAYLEDDSQSLSYADIAKIMGCHGKLKPIRDENLEYIAFSWEHPDTMTSITVTFNVQDDGTYIMNAHSVFPPDILL